MLQYLSEIVGGCDEYLICRKRECLFFTLNVNWVHAENHYRCPWCGWFYAPWVEKPSLINAQKIFVVDESDDMDDKSQVTYLLCEWADTATAILVNKFKQVATGLNADFAKMSSQMALDEITAFVRERGQRSYWEDFQMPAATVEYIEGLNRQDGDKGKPWVMDHLKAPFKGKRYSPKTPNA